MVRSAGPCTEACLSKVNEGRVQLTDRENLEMLQAPASSTFLKHSLKGAQSKNAVDRLVALREFTHVFLPIVFSVSAGQHAVNVATFMLEGGFLAPIVEGLKAAAGGDWVVVPDLSGSEYPAKCKKHGRAVRTHLSQALVAIHALCSLALDVRLVRFILRTRPDLLNILELLYIAAEKPRVPDGVLIRTEVARTLTRMTAFSEPLRKELAMQNPKFVLRLVTFASENVEEVTIFEGPFCLIANLHHYLELVDVSTAMVELTAKVLLHSQRATDITMGCRIYNHLREKAACSTLPDSRLFKSAVLALAICEADSLEHDARLFGFKLSGLYWSTLEDIPKVVGKPS
ncbi:hypothetical protein KFL_004040110 [Klebsormidium nitens]|uniref:Uncharacterized protein n=1 Tax=Klebsormidium nitens TaxID=105231 RepID=A0A1Y1IGG4_KLENI|nr:hypothetical protein KFL_004040110 [Klebsormidium nitens]|eukprot:GAQ88151.1 hypothetical protein KFL_004040110 [Klebsormidium nitens]